MRQLCPAARIAAALITTLILVLAYPEAASAQRATPNSRVVVGDQVKLWTRGLPLPPGSKGTVSEITSDTLRIRFYEMREAMPVPVNAVDRIERRDGIGRGRPGAIKGGAVGLALGGAIGVLYAALLHNAGKPNVPICLDYQNGQWIGCDGSQDPDYQRRLRKHEEALEGDLFGGLLFGGFMGGAAGASVGATTGERWTRASLSAQPSVSARTPGATVALGFAF